MKFKFLFILPVAIFIMGSSCKKDNLPAVTEGMLLIDCGGLLDTMNQFRKELALNWAPIHHQDVDPTGGVFVDHSLAGKSDYVAAMNFDGDWNALNNWENTATDSVKGVGYYTVVESGSHYFITYAFFHPRDWTDLNIGSVGEHENDLEAILTIIAKDSTKFGEMIGGVTVFHNDFYLYATANSGLTDGADGSIQSTPLTLEVHNGSFHPVTAQEAKGHGMKAWPDISIGGGDGVIYYPYLSLSEQPTDIYDNHVGYTLVDMFASNEIWDQRDTPYFFNISDQILGDNGSGANPPWRWDDWNDGDNPMGEIATDPIRLVNNYFGNLGSFDTTYVFNVYQGIY
jgi:hypothetical protein